MKRLRKPGSDFGYQNYGVYYDELIAAFARPKSWKRARMRLVRRALPDLQSVCELGCGTGISAIEFARQGLRVYAVDRSFTMLRIARQRIRKAGVRVRLIRADMRSFRLPEAVDLISAEWGVLNHVPRPSDLILVARAVARGLRPGGYFLFDVNHRILFEDVWITPQIYENRRLFSISQGGWDPQRKRGWKQMTLFVPTKAGLWRRLHDGVEEVQWSISEIRRALLRTGFDRIRAFDYEALTSAPNSSSDVRGCKTLFLARKRSA